MQVTIIKSNRKTISIQINPDLTVTVRAPRRMPKREIDRILQEKVLPNYKLYRKWIKTEGSAIISS